ncbi:unnamed protein product, partial [Didymodactylos carnosus]
MQRLRHQAREEWKRQT